jgi:hypothetical protein
MTGKVVKSKFAKTATPALVQARTEEEVVEALEAASAEVAEAMEAATEVVTAVAAEAMAEVMAPVVDMAADSKAVAATAAEDTVVAAVVTGTALRLSKPWLQTRSPTSLPLAPSLAQSSTCAT